MDIDRFGADLLSDPRFHSDARGPGSPHAEVEAFKDAEAAHLQNNET